MSSIYTRYNITGITDTGLNPVGVSDFFLVLKLLHNCEDHFQFTCVLYLQSTQMIFIIIHIMSFSSYNGYKLNLHMTCFLRGFIAHLVEHHTGIVEIMGSNPVGDSEFFLSFICNCLSFFTTVRITFT